ncbi:two-component system, chemotaxis family, response regulator CheY [Syntrophus gentianae]|uniref:Two-component system, chemotaxis family, response regulator CheY n=1 Tax=Syntrophus gentianae TaxID=43775 RepID=A0A1H7WZ53_9BACT|nr:response regulator [Syntrophus gentianae]SEM26625.1 two-component system, chemotaxis family, response regulator CheY [Syntrophus gentianae]
MSFNVLIVDDSNSMRGVIKKIISMSGFKVDTCLEAGNGREAVTLLENNWVDVIISDINMPEMNGLEMLSHLKKDDLFRDIPVIMITTEGSSTRMEEAFQYGAKGFIKKPFLPEDLKKILNEVLGVCDDGSYGENEGDDNDFDF